ncbi:hypothetical protein SAMN05444411_102247 [Lutibacter oricola]|uniref:Uncharacterized protein n=1 Tax=Lutibacter oricola TaxID=762486 RepID=A0A1H2WNN4_9FLAO|nr:hypothetical protein [Lutibacter oricola]SDW82242.1 hypothetical protein SAMN05444411_102247 [Lutibacter oricola]
MKKLLRYPNKQKAVDKALWLNFEYRTNNKQFGVIQSTNDDYLVVLKDSVSFERKNFEKLPCDYSKLSYKKIQMIAMDEDPLNHWEEIRGLFSVMDGELLRYIIHSKIPLEKFIRFELAARGFDKNHQWCGFDKAEKIWLK